MNITELKTYLAEHLVPAKLYQIGSACDGRICLEKMGELWEVFFCEKGRKFCTSLFQDEQTACAALLRELSKVMEIAYDVRLTPAR